jgi:hypothetical protein
MATEDQPVRIISNESNHVTEIESGPDGPATPLPTTAEKVAAKEQLENSFGAIEERSQGEITTNDGTVVETLDTAFHAKPGVAEGENLSGSDRADYYEARSYGKSDVEEEVDHLQSGQPE